MPSGKRHYRLTLSDALEAHEVALRYGGADGIISLDLIEAAIGRPYTGYYLAIYKKAAALVESMCMNHGFTDGNKRTSLLLLEILLQRSGYKLRSLNGEELNKAVEDMLVSVASGDMVYGEVELWMKARIEKLPHA